MRYWSAFNVYDSYSGVLLLGWFPIYDLLGERVNPLRLVFFIRVS